MGANGLPCLVAEPGRGSARAPLRLEAVEYRRAAGDRGWTRCLCSRCRQGGRGGRRLHKCHRWSCAAGPYQSSVIPLPHQIHALSRAISGYRRYLLADEVGLGKTIEAGLIMRELKLRGLVRRTLVVAPKGLATQWVAEMQTHFNEQFQLMLGDDIGILRRLVPGADHRSSTWSMFDQVIVSLTPSNPWTSGAAGRPNGSPNTTAAGSRT